MERVYISRFFCYITFILSIQVVLCCYHDCVDQRYDRHILYPAKLQASINTGPKKLEPYFSVLIGSYFCTICECNTQFRILDPLCSAIICFYRCSLSVSFQKVVPGCITLAYGGFCNCNQLLPLKSEFGIVHLRCLF